MINILSYPRFYKLKFNNQVLYTLGVTHSNNPQNLQFKKIEEYWQEFLNDVQAKESIVFVEGGDWPIEKSARKAITTWGESGYVAYLAHNSKIEWISPEPDRFEEMKQLNKKFSKEDILYYYFIRMALQWSRVKSDMDLANYTNMQQYIELQGWEDCDVSVEHYQQEHIKKYGHELDLDDRPNCLFDHHYYQVEDESVRIRDKSILKWIKDYLKLDRNIFLVYGATHTQNLRPTLVKLASKSAE